MDECFLIDGLDKTYKHQYANIYFTRLTALRNFVQEAATHRWSSIQGNPVLVPRVLDVTNLSLCYIIGTVYIDMPLKPNVLHDIARDRSLPAPPPPKKIHSPHDNVMLEDESGRVRLVGDPIRNASLVTGIIIGALGMENQNGDFETLDICYPGLPPQAPDHHDTDTLPMDIDQPPEWIALLSGLDVGSDSPSDALIQLLVEFLTGEAGHIDDKISASQISRLIIAGNSLAPVISAAEEDRRPRRYGYDNTSFSPHPTLDLSAHLLDIARTIPIHILPGESDPSGTILPQQPLPRAMFGPAAAFTSLSCETNPTYLRIAAPPSPPRTLLVSSGQPLDDMFKYVPTTPTTRLALAESTLRWRHTAPTAPDTLWCHPYFMKDPFVLNAMPHVYIIGNQPRFQTRLVLGKGEGAPRCRIVLLPSFAKTGVLVLLNLRTLDTRTVQFAVQGMTGGHENGNGIDK